MLLDEQVTLATSAFCFLNPYTRMGGTELVSALFSECHKGVEDEWGLCLSDPGSWSQVTPVVGALLLALVVRGEGLEATCKIYVLIIAARYFDSGDIWDPIACWDLHPLSCRRCTGRQDDRDSTSIPSISTSRYAIFQCLQWG